MGLLTNRCNKWRTVLPRITREREQRSTRNWWDKLDVKNSYHKTYTVTLTQKEDVKIEAIFFFYNLFNDAFSSSDYIALTDRIIIE